VRQKMGNVKPLMLWQLIGIVTRMWLAVLNKGWWLKGGNFNSINVMYNTFSNIYFLSNVSLTSMKLIHKITFSMQIWFLAWGCLIFGIIFHSGKYGSALKKWLML
jgi:hypothetical protein